MRCFIYFICLLASIPLLSSRNILPEDADSYSMSLPIPIHCVIEQPPSLDRPLPPEESFDQYYKEQPGVTHNIYTDIATERKFRRVSVTPDGNCYFYALGITRKQLVETLQEQVNLYDPIASGPLSSLVDAYTTLNRLERLIINRVQTLEQPSDLLKLSNTLSNELNEKWTTEGISDDLPNKEQLISTLLTLQIKINDLIHSGATIAEAQAILITDSLVLQSEITKFFSSPVEAALIQKTSQYNQVIAVILNCFAQKHSLENLFRAPTENQHPTFQELPHTEKKDVLHKIYQDYNQWLDVHTAHFLISTLGLNIEEFTKTAPGKIQSLYTSPNFSTNSSKSVRYILFHQLVSGIDHADLLIPIDTN